MFSLPLALVEQLQHIPDGERSKFVGKAIEQALRDRL
jgi:hypothetical protein